MSEHQQPANNLIIDDHCVVLMHYQLDNGFGETVDSSRGGLPLTYMHNTGALLPALERELTGRQKGDEFEIAIYPEDGYGYRDDELVQKLPRTAFDDIEELHVGMRVRDNKAADSLAGDNKADDKTAGDKTAGDKTADDKTADHDPVMYTVLVIGDEEVTVDANHPLAGQVLHFRIAVVDVRKPSESELKEHLGEGAVWSPPWLESI